MREMKFLFCKWGPGWILLAIAIGFGGNHCWNFYQDWKYTKQFSSAEILQLRKNYRITQQIIAELELIHTYTKTNFSSSHPLIMRCWPRTVWYKARGILAEIAYLKKDQNLPQKPLPPFSNLNITPKNVNEILLEVLDEVISLRKHFGIQEAPPLPPLPNHALPGNVFQSLDLISNMINGINRDVIKPSHVYQLAEVLVWQINQLPLTEANTNNNFTEQHLLKSPRDVYLQGHKLLLEMQKYEIKNRLELNRNIIQVPKIRGHIRPFDIFKLLTIVVAEADALRIASGNNQALILPPIQEEKRPSDVYQKLNEALQLFGGNHE